MSKPNKYLVGRKVFLDDSVAAIVDLMGEQVDSSKENPVISVLPELRYLGRAGTRLSQAIASLPVFAALSPAGDGRTWVPSSSVAHLRYDAVAADSRPLAELAERLQGVRFGPSRSEEGCDERDALLRALSSALTRDISTRHFFEGVQDCYSFGDMLPNRLSDLRTIAAYQELDDSAREIGLFGSSAGLNRLTALFIRELNDLPVRVVGISEYRELAQRQPTPLQPLTHSGKWICLEGSDGSGKSTQVAKLVDSLRAQGIEVVRTREPGGSPSAEAIRNIVLSGDKDDFCAESELLLFMAARVEHIRQTIEPALARGAVVVQDRGPASTVAYQVAGGGVPMSRYEAIRDAFVHKEPDTVIVLDVPCELGLSRAGRRLEQDGSSEGRFESKGLLYYERVRQSFRDQAERHGWALVDATKSEDAVAEKVQSVVAVRMAAGLLPDNAAPRAKSRP